MAPDHYRVVVLLVMIAKIMSHPREIIVDEELPAKKANSMNMGTDEEWPEEVPCHLEYQVMKRVAGTCIKLGRSARACLAGDYLQPLHPECM